jgi:chemotaxis protein methyltransferase CheR
MADATPPFVVRGSLDRLIEAVSEQRGIDLSQYRRPYVERRVLARLRVLGITSYRHYIDLLSEDPGEYDRLMGTLTINVTDFFRDKGVWDVLKRRVLPDILEQKSAGRSRTIRAWSAGCSTGEEAYSLAMTLLDLLGEDAKGHLVSVLASDLDPVALATAERGVYRLERRRRIPVHYQVRFTRTLDSSEFEVLPEVRRLVRFRRLSLFDEAPLKVLDLILCRNVFIYFDREEQARALERFQGALARGGYLVLGRSEKLSAEAARCLEVVDGRERVYRKPART